MDCIKDKDETESLDLSDSESENESENENVDTMIQSIQSIQSESTESLKDFSKNSIINLARKAGVKCISHCGIEKVRTILNDKMKFINDKLVIFYKSNNSKTITKKMVIDFLHSEGIHMTMS